MLSFPALVSPGFVAHVASEVASLAHSRLKKLTLCIRRLGLCDKHYQQYDRRTCNITRSWPLELPRRYMAIMDKAFQVSEVELECSDCREEALVRESVTRWPIRRAPLHVIMLTCFKHYHFIKYLHHGTPSIQSIKPAEMR